MKTKHIIVIGKIIQIHNDHLLVSVNGEIHKCLKQDVSDFNCDLNTMFKINYHYKFSLIINHNEKTLSYKLKRPKLLKIGQNINETISGFKNVSNNMHTRLKEYKL